MNTRYLSVLILFLFLALSGCQDTKITYHINGDGTGKVEFDLTVMESIYNMNINNNGQNKNKEELLFDYFARFQDGFSGINVWDNISLKILDDNNAEIKATGYIDDILKFHENQINISMAKTQFTKQPDNNYKITLENKTSKFMRVNTPVKDMPEEEFEKKLKELKDSVAKMKMSLDMQKNLGAFNQDFSFIISINTAEKITATSGFKKVSDNHAKVEVNMDSYTDFYERLSNDEDLQREFLKETGASSLVNISQKLGISPERWLLDAKNGINVTWLCGTKKLFDYQKESATAKENYSKWLKKHGKAPLPVAGKTIEFEKLALLGIERIFYSDQLKHIRPFYKDKGMTIALYGKLPESVIKFDQKKSEAYRIENENGESLLPDKEWLQRINIDNSYSQEKLLNEVLFRVNLNEKALTSQKIKYLEAKLCYIAGSEIKTEETDIFSISEEQKSPLYGSVVNVKKHNNSLSIDLSINCNYNKFKSIKFVDEFGEQISGYKRRIDRRDDKSSLEYFIRNGDGVEKFKIVFEKYTDTVEGEVYFIVEDVPLKTEELAKDAWPLNKDGKSLKVIKKNPPPYTAPQKVEVF